VVVGFSLACGVAPGRTTSPKATRANSWPSTRRARIQIPTHHHSLMPLPFLLPPLSIAPPPRARHGRRLEAPRPCGGRRILRVRASGEATPSPSRTQVSEQPRPDPSPLPGVAVLVQVFCEPIGRIKILVTPLRHCARTVLPISCASYVAVGTSIRYKLP
jgi:hypothetical protein